VGREEGEEDKERERRKKKNRIEKRKKNKRGPGKLKFQQNGERYVKRRKKKLKCNIFLVVENSGLPLC
jgi:hypothetical protein